MVALVSKPGITSASTLSIPKDWSSSWFRNFIDNQLKGADVRNAVGSGGIKINGTIASPYATVGFQSQASGFGTPTGNVVIANFPGASATLAQTSATVAEILTILKGMGIIST